MNDRSRKPPSLWLIPVFPKHPSQLGLTPTVHYPGSSEGLPQIHPHIERTIILKTEPAPGFVELRRAHAKIQKNPVAAARRNPIRELGIIPAPYLEAPGKASVAQAPRRRLNGCAIAIAAIKPSIRAARRQYGGCVSSPTDRAVGDSRSRLWVERRQHLRHQDRFVDETWHCACSSGSGFACTEELILNPVPNNTVRRLRLWSADHLRSRLLGDRLNGLHQFQVSISQVIPDGLDRIEQ
jgi:hypothetical protein